MTQLGHDMKREILAHVLRQEKQMQADMSQPQATHQFAEDYILVTENDQDSYREILDMEETQAGNMSGLSDRLREQWEAYIGEVAERERENGHEVGALLISQMLTGWGSTTFDIIARHWLVLKTEQEVA